MKKIIESLFIMLLTLITITGCGIKNDTTTTYDGVVYKFEYNNDWSLTSVAGGHEALQYKNKKLYFAPISASTLEGYGFTTEEEKNILFNEFYELWNGDSRISITTSQNFRILKNDIYYATYDYVNENNNLNGRYYLLVSEKEDIILSFWTLLYENDNNNINNLVFEMLQNIKIQ